MQEKANASNTTPSNLMHVNYVSKMFTIVYHKILKKKGSKGGVSQKNNCVLSTIKNLLCNEWMLKVLHRTTDYYYKFSGQIENPCIKVHIDAKMPDR